MYLYSGLFLDHKSKHYCDYYEWNTVNIFEIFCFALLENLYFLY